MPGKDLPFTAEHLLLTILENKTTGMLVVMDDERIALINNVLAKALGKNHTDLLGAKLEDVYPRRGIGKIRAVLKSGAPETGRVDSIGGQNVLLDLVPIRKNDQVRGVLAKVSFLKEGPVKHKSDRGTPKRGRESRRSLLTVDHIIGTSPHIVDLKETIIEIAPRNSNILITGESGTGKELFAQAIHCASLRRSGPYVKVNCAAIPETLLESEFFGYEEGAFTGGREGGRVGKFELARGGTIFLDEVADLSLPLQAKLLRFVQDKEIQKLGGGETTFADVRVIAATNDDLGRMVKYKSFREDLYYRLNVVSLWIPPLRQRRDDIMALTRHCINKFNRLFGLKIKGVTPGVEEVFMCHAWPGNVRELENVIERAFNVVEGELIKISHLPPEMVTGGEGVANPVHNLNIVDALQRGQSLSDIMEEMEKMVVLQALLACKGNKMKASKMLGISRPGLYKKLMKYKLV